MNAFDQFSAAYPAAKRESGKRATAIFEAAVRKAPLATLLEALARHKASTQWEIPRYIPLMTNWLLGEHWTRTLASPTPSAPAALSAADQAQRWHSLSPQEQLRRLGVKR